MGGAAFGARLCSAGRNQPQQLRKSSRLECADAPEHFHVLRLVLCTQPHSNPADPGADCEQLIFELRGPAATMSPMADPYEQLLDATIQHLEDLKTRGVRHVAVAPETLRALAQPPAVKFQMEKAAAPLPEIRSSRREEAMPLKSAIRHPPSAISESVAEQATLLTLPGETQSTITNPQSPIEKAAAFAALRERALACVKCPHLASSRKNVVFGVGSIDAQLMFVGEAPGADEDEQGE